MNLKLVMLAGVAIVTLSGTMLTPAIADDYYTSKGSRVHDDQADETRSLNLQALEAARNQDASPRSAPDDADNDAEEPNDGQGGPEFQGPPGPNDMGEPDDDDDQSDSPDDDDSGPEPR